MTKTTTTSTEGLMLTAVGATVAYVWFTRRRSSKQSPKALPSTPSPFIAGSSCTRLADVGAVDRWLDETVAPLVLPKLDAFDIPLDEHECAREAVEILVDEVFASAAPECAAVSTPATRRVWTWVWCDVVAQLIARGALDEELDDVLRLCADPSFDPRAPANVPARPSPHPLPDRPTFEPPHRPPPPRPRPAPLPDPTDGFPVEPEPTAPPNLRRATTRAELSSIGVLRMMEGNLRGIPIHAPRRHLVMLAVHPAWPHLGDARAALAQWAEGSPDVMFVEVSFADTQRHFGKPKDINELAWALTAAGPEGRVYHQPILGKSPESLPPQPKDWTTLIAYARGDAHALKARRMLVPRRFGDLTRAMVKAHWPGVGQPTGPSHSRRRPNPHPRPRRRG